MIRLTRAGDRLRLMAPAMPQRAGIPNCTWDADAAAWWLPATDASVRAVLTAFAGKPLEIASDCGDLLAAPPRDPATVADQDLPPIPITRTAPWRHQVAAFWHCWPRDAAMLAVAMGGGKSKTVCDLIVNRALRRVLILCPKSVIAAWPKQVDLHIGAGWQVLALDEGPVADRAATVHAALGADAPCIVVLNYDAARQPAMRAVLLAQDWDLTVVDESHKIADSRTAINQLCCALRDRSRYRLALTGTPFKQTPLDIFGQFLFLDPAVFGPSFYRFRQHYAEMGGFDGKQVIGLKPDHEADLLDRFARLAFRVGTDVLDLPDVQHIALDCTLSDKARGVYSALASRFAAEIDEGKVTAANGGVKVLRLQQITGGNLTTDDGVHIGIDQAKADALRDLLDSLPAREPLVVFARFTYDLKAIELAVAASRRRYAELSGDRRELQRWQAGDADVLGVQIQAGGTGIDLTRAHYGAYYSVGYSLTDYEQSLARIHRPGQAQPVTYYHLIARHTIDERVYAALRNRKEVIADLLGRSPHLATA